jgi:hypothetical protein
MAEIFDFFPFDMPPGFGFVVVYLGIAGAVLLLATVVRNELARTFDEASAPKITAPPPTIGGYRAAAPGGWAPPLAVGVLPRGEQLWTVAWLRAGNDGVTQALMANAAAEGWLSSTEDGNFQVMAIAPPSDRVAAMFYDKLRGTTEVLTPIKV